MIFRHRNKNISLKDVNRIVVKMVEDVMKSEDII